MVPAMELGSAACKASSTCCTMTPALRRHSSYWKSSYLSVSLGILSMTRERSQRLALGSYLCQILAASSVKNHWSFALVVKS